MTAFSRELKEKSRLFSRSIHAHLGRKQNKFSRTSREGKTRGKFGGKIENADSPSFRNCNFYNFLFLTIPLNFSLVFFLSSCSFVLKITQSMMKGMEIKNVSLILEIVVDVIAGVHEHA